ncbi:MAG: hypothetical protein O2907_09760 [Proteobacteria bacterium]|nr:hypothetical protein [Pseudomonadota bacterium]MDA1064590.1 hypothetical protein [Pseudomonadota bacterium]
MNLRHPLARLFAAMSMIVAIAATTVTVALTDQVVDQNINTTAITSPAMPESVVAVQAEPEVS